jgi:hypothetical protein
LGPENIQAIDLGKSSQLAEWNNQQDQQVQAQPLPVQQDRAPQQLVQLVGRKQVLELAQLQLVVQ